MDNVVRRNEKMFYEVKACCGHVGRGHYIVKSFYLWAENAKEAASIVRWKPRVKHNWKYAIEEVKNVSLLDYIAGFVRMELDPYFRTKNSSDQKRLADYPNWDIRTLPKKEVPIRRKRRHGFYASKYREQDREDWLYE